MTKISFNPRLLIRIGQHHVDFNTGLQKVLEYHRLSKSPESKGDPSDILVAAQNILSTIPQAWYQEKYDDLRTMERDGYKLELSFTDKLDRVVEIVVSEI
jgi:hypothetical protein